MKKCLITVVCYLVAAVAQAQGGSAQMPIRVSLIELVTNAEKYDGKRIAVYGYLARHVDLDLFVTKEHAQGRDFRSAIAVADTDNMDVYESGCLETYVVLTGKLVVDKSGPVLTAVERVYDSAESRSCWESSS